MVVKHGQHKLVLTQQQHNLPTERISKLAIKVIKRLKQAGYEAYLVGGGVRDLLLGKTPKDFDVSTNATPEQVRRLFSNARIIGRRFRIVHIVYNNNDIIEVTTFRGGNANRSDVQASPDGMLIRDNSYGKSIKEDAQRRDFTINAIYLDIQTGNLIDFHGGLYDLTQGVIDIIGDPETRYREDPVRILRAARFSAKLGFKISNRTVELIGPCSSLLSQVASARMYDEVNKLFLTGHAKETFRVLTALGIFDTIFNITPMLLNSSACREFLMHAFESTDERFAQGKCNKPHFLYAIILWNEFIWSFYQMRDELMLSADNIDYRMLISNLASHVVLAQYQLTAMPEQVISSIVILWRLQFLLESNDPEKYAKETTSYHAFRAAFDLFKLRAKFDDNLASRVEFWQPYYDACKADAEKRRLMSESSRGGKGGRHRRNNNNNKGHNGERSAQNNGNNESNEGFTSEKASERQDRTNRARAWREAMNLAP